MSNFEIDHGVCGKKRYADKRTALTVANQRGRREFGRRRGKVKHLRAYACPECEGWHLSSRV